jgi:hypothetical protein
MAGQRDDAGQQRGSDAAPGTNERTTIAGENARRDERERFQPEHPDELAGRGRDPEREDVSAPLDPDDSERFRARETEDVSEG